ncbi:hypothetical protein APHAL10511_005256 [Amanita phalloides]|nr:hypothetical protein APHAL10511_005256 [Amanita phalloides]
MSSITAWAAAVIPGSPAPPSPPTIVDLTPFGYTTIFLHFPHLPSTALPPSPLPKQQSSTLRRLRSLAGLRTRSKSVSGAVSKPKPPKHAHVVAPRPLANELALMQFVNGGSIETHAKRVMMAQARAAAGSHHNSRPTGVGEVYRDEFGRIWWDEDEEYEYAHLLDGENADMYAYEGNEGMEAWVKFGKDSRSWTPQRSVPLAKDMITADDLKRKESTSTRDSHIDIVKPAEEAAYPVVPGLSVLSVPSRAKRAANGTAKHLRKPEFIVDVAAFGPRSPNVVNKASADVTAPKGKARRRPAPLTILPSASLSKKPTNPALPTAGLPSAEGLRREFVENSFYPIPLPQPQIHTQSSREFSSDSTPKTATKGWRLRIPQIGTFSSSVKKPSTLDLRVAFEAGIRNK